MKRTRHIPKEMGIFSVLVVVYLLFGLLAPTFMTTSNTFTLLLNGSVVALLAIGETFVLLTAGIDLSVGAGIALSGVVAAIAIQHGLPWYVGVLLALASTTLIGLFNGVVIHYVKVPPFIVTFATMGVASSIPLILTNATPIPITSNTFSFIGQGFIGPIPFAVLLLAVVAIIAHLILSRTVFGLHVYSVGGNRESARLAGVNTAKVDVVVYMVSGLMAGLGGLVDASRLMSGYPTAGSGTSLFFSISAAVVGGVSLFGGVGTILGAIIGAVLIAVVSDGMDIMNVSSYWQPLVIGLIILVGVTIDTLRVAQSQRVSFREVFVARFTRRAVDHAAGEAKSASK
ncbi:sugar ABC transporter permease [Sulfobacillus thermotolerans]|uniref:Sugar ABC transporter permease n=1 Tax=Sulfobacillus thermotolerans TaxID=338644 RepID=A0ABM6RSD9_9FIRM|nr:sugar ABC transporter permease [Sulfobacillus thermotolerans]